MMYTQKISRKLNTLYRRFILRDRFLMEASRWFMDRGDETLRLDYPLNQDSVVFDLGGYKGDFAYEISKKFGCKIFVFEPVLDFHEMCVDRFKGNKSITCMNYGLSSRSGHLDINLSENSSSFFSATGSEGGKQRVKIESIADCIRKLEIKRISLMKINIEGGEFDVLPELIASGDIARIDYLQIQFHNFVADAAKRRAEIRATLLETHKEMWNYDFVWESWERK